MRTQTIKAPSKREKKRIETQRETVITKVLSEDYKRRQAMQRMSVKEYKAKLNPLEENEQMKLAQLLDSIGVLWLHPPNEIKCNPQYLKKRARLGVKAGVPDVIIFDSPPNSLGHRGAAIELKRKKGGTLSDAQADWLLKLAARGWAIATCKGIDQAIKQLRIWGYMR